MMNQNYRVLEKGSNPWLTGYEKCCEPNKLKAVYGTLTETYFEQYNQLYDKEHELDKEEEWERQLNQLPFFYLVNI